MDYKKNDGISLTDIINEIHYILLNKLLKNNNEKYGIFNKYVKILSNDQITFIFEKIRCIEYCLSICNNDDLQIGAFIGIFKYILSTRI